MSPCAEVRGEYLCGSEGNENTCADVKGGQHLCGGEGRWLQPTDSPWVC